MAITLLPPITPNLNVPLSVQRESSIKRFESALENIYEKYGRDFEDTEEIDLKTGEMMVRGKGHLKQFYPETIHFGTLTAYMDDPEDSAELSDSDTPYDDNELDEFILNTFTKALSPYPKITSKAPSTNPASLPTPSPSLPPTPPPLFRFESALRDELAVTGLSQRAETTEVVPEVKVEVLRMEENEKPTRTQTRKRRHPGQAPNRSRKSIKRRRPPSNSKPSLVPLPSPSTTSLTPPLPFFSLESAPLDELAITVDIQDKREDVIPISHMKLRPRTTAKKKSPLPHALLYKTSLSSTPRKPLFPLETELMDEFAITAGRGDAPTFIPTCTLNPNEKPHFSLSEKGSKPLDQPRSDPSRLRFPPALTSTAPCVLGSPISHRPPERPLEKKVRFECIEISSNKRRTSLPRRITTPLPSRSQTRLSRHIPKSHNILPTRCNPANNCLLPSFPNDLPTLDVALDNALSSQDELAICGPRIMFHTLQPVMHPKKASVFIEFLEDELIA